MDHNSQQQSYHSSQYSRGRNQTRGHRSRGGQYRGRSGRGFYNNRPYNSHSHNSPPNQFKSHEPRALFKPSFLLDPWSHLIAPSLGTGQFPPSSSSNPQQSSSSHLDSTAVSKSAGSNHQPPVHPHTSRMSMSLPPPKFSSSEVDFQNSNLLNSTVELKDDGRTAPNEESQTQIEGQIELDLDSSDD